MDAELSERLETYYRLLAKWSTKINLTGINLTENSPEALDRLLIEPLVAVKHVPIRASRMLDLGSGGGSPAIPMALALPQVRLTMVESKTRKAVFLREAVRVLGIPDVEVITARFEELLARPDLHETQDLVTIRAVRLEMRTLMTLQAFIKPGGLALLFRASASADPSKMLAPPLTWRGTFALVESLRSRLVVLEKQAIGGHVPRGTHST